MKKLADETYDYEPNDYRRTIWYEAEEADTVLDEIFGPADAYGGRRLEASDFTAFADFLADFVKSDQKIKQKQAVTETQWVFYTQLVNGDAIGDKVRFTILLREKGGDYDCTVNMTDYIFASSYEKVKKLRQQLILAILEK